MLTLLSVFCATRYFSVRGCMVARHWARRETTTGCSMCDGRSKLSWLGADACCDGRLDSWDKWLETWEAARESTDLADPKRDEFEPPGRELERSDAKASRS